MSFFDAILAMAAAFVHLLIWVVIINAVLSWLVAFDVVNYRNRAVAMIGQFTDALTRPFVRPLQRFIPPLGGVDLSPLVLLLILNFLVLGWLIPTLGALLP